MPPIHGWVVFHASPEIFKLSLNLFLTHYKLIIGLNFFLSITESYLFSFRGCQNVDHVTSYCIFTHFSNHCPYVELFALVCSKFARYLFQFRNVLKGLFRLSLCKWSIHIHVNTVAWNLKERFLRVTSSGLKWEVENSIKFFFLSEF